jgi:hypothetical protein
MTCRVGSTLGLQIKNKRNGDCAIHRYQRIAQSCTNSLRKRNKKFGGAIEGPKGHDIHSTTVLMATPPKIPSGYQLGMAEKNNHTQFE